MFNVCVTPKAKERREKQPKTSKDHTKVIALSGFGVSPASDGKTNLNSVFQFPMNVLFEVITRLNLHVRRTRASHNLYHRRRKKTIVYSKSDPDMCKETQSLSTCNVHTRHSITTSVEAGSPASVERSTVPDGEAVIKSPPSPSKMKKTEFFESLDPWQQFILLAFTMFLFFGMHNVLQEAMMGVEGFHGVMLGYMEVFGVTLCSYIERRYVAKETKTVAPMASYPLLTGCLMASSCLSNMSLNYINFPTKVVFRSCKLIPTMVIATIINRRIFQSIEYVAALSISIGLIVFAAADWKLTPSFNSTGIILVSLSVFADAILPNAQERIFSIGASRLEVTYFTNLFTLIAMTVTTVASGDLKNLIQLARTSDSNLITYMVVYTMISYVAISSFMTIVKKYGGVTAVLLGTARKGMTLILSFLLFPKQFSWLYVLGATMVLGGLLVASLVKQFSKKNKNVDKKELSEAEVPLLDDRGEDVEMGKE